MAGQKLTLQIEVNGTSQTVSGLKEIQKAIGGLVDDTEQLNSLNLGDAIGGVTRLAFAYNEVTGAVQNLLGQLQPAYELLIGSNEQLNQQLLQSAASITATSRVFQDGIQIEDPTQSIQSLQPLLQQAIRDVEQSTQSLVGITSQQTSTVFNTILSNVGLLNDQLKGAGEGGQDLNNAIEAAASLAPGLVATLGTLQLPLEQASDEIGNLLRGEIDMTAQVAKSLGITREMVQNWKAQGILVSELNKRFEPFLAANALASRSVSGLTSNIQDIVEVVGRTAGAPLLDILVNQLDQVYQLLQANQGEITDVAVGVVAQIATILQGLGDAITQIAQTLQPAAQAIGQALLDAFGAGLTTAETTLNSLTQGIVALIQVATPFIQLISALVSGLSEIASTPAGQVILQISGAFIALNAVVPTLSGNIASIVESSNNLFSTFNNLLPLLQQTNIAKTALAAKELILAAAVGTTTAGLQAQALATAAAEVGNTKLALAATQAAAAERAKAAAMVQSARATALAVGRIGLLAAAVGSIALAVSTYRELTQATREAAESIENIQQKLNLANQTLASVATTGSTALKSNAQIAADNLKAIEEGVSGVQKFLDGVRQGIRDIIIPFFAQMKAFAPILKQLFPDLAPAIDTAIGKVDELTAQIPGLGSAADAAVRDFNAAFSEASGQAANTLADIDALLRGNLSQSARQGIQSSLDNARKELTAINEQIAAAGASGDDERVSRLEAERAEIEKNIQTYQNQQTAIQNSSEQAIAAIDAQIALLEKQKPTEDEDVETQSRQLELLRQRRSQLNALSGDIAVQSQLIQDQGTIYEQLNTQAQRAADSVASASNAEQLNSSAQQLIELTEQQVELGQITADQAKQRLTQLAEDGRVELDIRRQAVQAATQITEQGAENQLATLQRQQSQVEALRSRGLLTETEAQKRLTQLQQQEAQQRLSDVQAAITAEQEAIAGGRGSQQRLDELRTQEASIAAEVASTRQAATEASVNAELAIFQRRQQEIEQLEASGVIRDAEAQRRITANRVNEVQKRIELIRAQIAAEQQAGRDPQGLIEQERQLATELANARSEAESAALQARLDEVERAGREVVQAVELAEVQRNVILQRQLNAGLITEQEFNRRRIEGQQETIRAQIAAEEDRVRALRSLPLPSDPDEREGFEQQIRDSIQRTASLQLQLLENERQAQQAVREEALRQLDRQSRAIQTNAQKAEVASSRRIRLLQGEVQEYDQILQALEQEGNLLNARGQLLSAQQGLTQTLADLQLEGLREAQGLQEQLNQAQEQGNTRAVQLIRDRLRQLGVNPYASQEDILEQIVDAERERARIAEQTQERQQELARQQLELDIRREEIASRRALLEARIAESQARQELSAQRSAVREAETELERAQLIEDPQERADAIAAAQVGLADAREQESLAEQSLGFAEEGVDIAEENLSQLDETAAIQRESLALEQQTADATLEAANNAAIFRAELEAANASAQGISSALGLTGGNVQIPARRTGGPVEAGTLYQVHKDELIVPRTDGYVLNKRDSMAVARSALAQGIPAPTIAGLSSVAPQGDVRLLRAIDKLSKDLSRVERGITIQNLSQSITNQVPRDAAAIARLVEENNLNFIRELRNRIS